jgi:flagellar FliL protein
MSETAPPPEGVSAQPRGPFTPLTFVILGVAVLAGAVTGVYLVGPRLASARQGTAAATDTHGGAAAEASGDHGKSDGHGKSGGSHGKGGGSHGKGGERAAMFRLDNIIVNPSDSQGTRFLMVTVAFELADDKQHQRLRDSEIQLRDRVISTLERHTLAELTAPGARDSLKARITRDVTSFVGPGGAEIYLPQFVIQ